MRPHTFIIAEAGVNHNGKLDLARQMIEEAAAAGADAVKFQSFRTEALVTRHAAKADYQAANTGGQGGQYAMLKALELSARDHEVLLGCCRDNGVVFLSSAFDPPSIRLLENLGLDRYKIPSGEVTNLPYLRLVAETGKPVIMSTGMATLDEIRAALDVFYACGYASDWLALLHCTTDYPAPFEDVNLRAIETLRRTFGLRCGYSDHTLGIEVPVAAVALGAEIVEKHFTLDRGMPGPDHRASIDPGQLRAMVRAIRNIEVALGDGTKTPSAGEMRHRNAVRKRIVARRPIRGGEVFTTGNLAVKRPGDGMSPMRWDALLGRTASRDYETDDPIEEALPQP